LQGRYEVVVRCLVGVIFDSSPVDYLGEHGARFVSHQMLTLEPGKPFTLISRVASAVGKGVDFIFSKQMEVRREELWHALYSSVVYLLFISAQKMLQCLCAVSSKCFG
jgi:hypothetical protein